MHKINLFGVGALFGVAALAGLGVWVASTTQARIDASLNEQIVCACNDFGRIGLMSTPSGNPVKVAVGHHKPESTLMAS
jgi:hypothetical protein